jgi:phi LC3 family holin
VNEEKKNLDFRARFKNPAFWLLLAGGIVCQMLTFMQMTPADLNNWPAVWKMLEQFAANPYWVWSTAAYVVATVVDPTTQGMMDPMKGEENGKY